MTTDNLYAWLKKYGPRSVDHKAELKRFTDERDILKKPRRTSPSTTSIEMFYNTRRRHGYNNQQSLEYYW